MPVFHELSLQGLSVYAQMHNHCLKIVEFANPHFAVNCEVIVERTCCTSMVKPTQTTQSIECCRKCKF